MWPTPGASKMTISIPLINYRSAIGNMSRNEVRKPLEKIVQEWHKLSDFSEKVDVLFNTFKSAFGLSSEIYPGEKEARIDIRFRVRRKYDEFEVVEKILFFLEMIGAAEFSSWERPGPRYLVYFNV